VTGTAFEAATTSISISGMVKTPAGVGVCGVTMQLNGNKQERIVTAGDGTYAFTGLNAGSYSVQPANIAGCEFTPNVVNLNNITTSQTQNFTISGSSCNPPS
jgi:SdrD B-like domain